MDLACLIANKPLLASLSREYELLKSTNADINYEEWIVKRLKLAAAQQNSSKVSAPAISGTAATTKVAAERKKQQQQQHGAATAVDELTANLQQQAPQEPSVHGTAGAAACDKDGAVLPGGEQDAAAGTRPVLQELKALDTTNTQQQASSQLLKRGGLHSRGPAVLQRLPEALLHPSQQMSRGTSTQPTWVAAAKLHSSLQSSGVVPLMHAAAERDRRLAATAAMVRQQLALGGSSSSLPQQQALLVQHHRHGMDANEQDKQQELLQQVVQQNQQLLQAVQQQQALLHRHEGLLAGGTDTAPLPSGSNAAPGAAAAIAANPSSAPQQLRAVLQNSWLVKSALQPACSSTSNGKPGQSNQDDAPEFIRITGEAGRRKKPQQQQQQQQQQQPPSDRRSQLKAALKQLLIPNSSAALPEQQQQQQDIARLLQSLLGGQQQGMAQDGEQPQQQLQRQLLLDLQRAVQGLAGKQRQQQGSSLWQSQDENLTPIKEGGQPEQQVPAASRTHMQQQRLRLAASSIRRSAAGPARHAGNLQDERHRQRERPAWQSEPFMPPPAHMLRKKISGVADAWGLPPPVRAPVRPASATSAVNPGRPASSRAVTAKGSSRRASSAIAKRQQQQQLGQQQPCSPAGVRCPSPKGYEAWWERAERGFTAEGASDPGQVDRQHVVPQMMGPAAAAGLPSMTAEQVQGVELEVKQQLEQEREGEGRLSRLEETASHILGVLGRLEQQLQSSTPAAGGASDTGSGATPAPGGVLSSSGLLQDPLMMSSMLSALDRIEAQEQEIRRRWFGSSDISAARPAAPVVGAAASTRRSVQASVLEVQDGVLTAHCSNAAEAAAAAGGGASERQGPDSQHQAAADPQQQQQQQEVLSNEALRSIKSGRRRFLRHQALVDGSLEVLDSPGAGADLGSAVGAKTHRRAKQQLQPTYVVEAVADLLLDELLLGQVEELDGFCDALCNQLFDDEFEEA